MSRTNETRFASSVFSPKERNSRMNDDFPGFIKLEDFDLDCQSFFSGSEVNLNEDSNLYRPLIDTNRQRSVVPINTVPIQTNNSIAAIEKENAKGWMDELFEYSSNIAKSTQATLGRIRMDFMKNGLTFDADFRNHFLYIANNRIIESFDAFLIGLPREMKASDCTISKPKIIPRPATTNVIERSKSFEPPAKRKRVDNSTVIGSSANRIANARTTQVAPQLGTAKIASRASKTVQATSQSQKIAQVTSLSGRSGQFASASKIGQEISVKKVVSKVTETSTSSSTSTSLMMKNGRVIIHRVDELPKLNLSNNTTIARNRKEDPPRPNKSADKVVPRRIEDMVKTTVPKNTSSLDNTIDTLRSRIILTENRIEPMKSLQRRKSMGAMVSIPTLRIGKESSTTPAEAPKEQQRGKPQKSHKSSAKEVQESNPTVAAKPIIARRKTFVDKDLLLSHNSKNDLTVIGRWKAPVQQQSNATLPVVNSGVVTRSRRSAGDLSRTANLFTCETCGYTTEVRTNFHRHILTHTGEKPFKCKHCPKNFTQKVNLKSHLKCHHHDLHGDPNYWL